MSFRTSPIVTRSFILILTLLAVPRFAAQAADFDRHYDILATDGAFQPAVLTAQPGERIHITVYNRGRMNHSIVFILPQGYIGMRRVIPPWREGSMTFQAPTVTGEYVFYCPVFNRGAAGMQGLLIVGTGQ
jgi:plastocyanin